MQLTINQRKELREALMNGFPNRDRLELMLQDELGVNLNRITESQSDYEATVGKVINWAEANGKVQELLTGAISQNSGNPKLQKFAEIFCNKQQKVNSDRSHSVVGKTTGNNNSRWMLSPKEILALLVVIGGIVLFAITPKGPTPHHQSTPSTSNDNSSTESAPSSQSTPSSPSRNSSYPCSEGYTYFGSEPANGQYSGWCNPASSSGERYECIGNPGTQKCRKPES
jgi:hypothetical protein